jgi:hypothetical protein
VGAKSDSKAVVLSGRQKLLAKFFMILALKVDSLICLLSKICLFVISRIGRLTENYSTPTHPNKFSRLIG